MAGEDEPDWKQMWADLLARDRVLLLYDHYSAKAKAAARPLFEEALGRAVTDAEYDDVWADCERQLTRATIRALIYGEQ